MLYGLEYDKMDLNVIYAASSLWILDYYVNDKNAFRFYEEFIVGTLTSVDIVMKEKERHYVINQAKNVEVNNLEYISARFASIGLQYYYLKGTINSDYEEFCKYYILVSGILLTLYC